jgi:hypothetical protein
MRWGELAKDQDTRTRIIVFMLAAKQKAHRSFYCNNCGMKVCELEDNIAYLSDVINEGAILPSDTGVIAIKCSGKFCRNWYEFIVRPN